MKKKKIYGLLLLLLLCKSPSLCAGTIDILGVQTTVDTLEYRMVGPGVSYARLSFPSYPLSVYMLTIDLNNPYNFIETFQANEQVGKTEAMTAAYNRLNTQQHRSIAGVNGNFWIVSGQGQPTELLGVPHSGSMKNGELLSDPNNWNRGRGATAEEHLQDIGFAMMDKNKKTWIDDIRFEGKVHIDGVGEYPIAEINRIREANELVFFNHYLGPNQPTRTGNDGIEVFIKPVNGQAWSVNQAVVCEVTRIIKDKGANLLQEGESVLSGTGAARVFLENLSTGQQLTVNMGIQTRKDNLPIPAEQMITGNALVMKDGILTPRNYNEEYNTQLYPRTGIGTSEDGKTLYWIVIDKGSGSAGASTATMCGILKSCGATSATSMDGGGSAQMMLEGAIINKSSDGKERAVANGWFLFHNAPDDNQITKLMFKELHPKVMKYASYRPQVLGYNTFGVLVAPDLKDFTLTCSPDLGTITPDGFFVATGTAGSGFLTATSNTVSVSCPVEVLQGALSIRLDSVLIDQRRPYSIEMLTTNTGTTMPVPPELLSWTVADNTVCAVENGILTALKNGTTTVEGSLGTFKASLKVKVEIPETNPVIIDRFADGKLDASSFLNAGFSANNIHFTYASGRAPFIKLTNTQVVTYGLPDTIKIALNVAEVATGNVSVSLKANNATKTVSKTFNALQKNTDIELAVPVNEVLDTSDRAIYPIRFDNINFYIEVGGMTAGQSYTIVLKEIALVYAGMNGTKITQPRTTDFSVYPNPVTGNEITIRLNDSQEQSIRVEIYTLSGQKVQAESLGIQAGAVSFKKKNLQPGIYLLKVYRNEQTDVVKLIIK
ncbi:hypothetical protein FACS1894182_07630 [Bacteroidia bacterium]|nr:hypothetical protein FACS1894182_07630 [Bacteroidia bacterium]